MIRKLSLNDDAKAAQLKKNIWPVLAVDVNRLGVCRDPKARNKDGKLGVYYLLPVSVLCHLILSHCVMRNFAI
jgi:hypothetical protein